MNQKITKRSALVALFCLALSIPILCAESQTANAETSATAKKLEVIKLPSVELKDVSFQEALGIIRKQARLHDPEENPDKKGVNFIIKSSEKASRPLTLTLTNVSLGDTLRTLCSLTGYKMKIGKNSIVFKNAK